MEDGIGPNPPAIYSLAIESKTEKKVTFTGTEEKDGSAVKITLEGDTSYFEGVKEVKASFDPKKA